MHAFVILFFIIEIILQFSIQSRKIVDKTRNKKLCKIQTLQNKLFIFLYAN